MAFGLASCAPGDELRARVDGIARAITPAMFECPDRAWTRSAEHLRSAQVVLTAESEGRAFLWNDLSDGPRMPPRLTEIALGSLDVRLRPSSYGYGVLDGAPTLAVSLDGASESDGVAPPAWHESAITLALHEAFHAHGGQREWAREGGSRAVYYPERSEPRYLRAALEAALLAVVRREPAASLGHAAFWQERYVDEEAADAASIRDTDRLEGSAQLFTAIGEALADLGCGATDDALDDAVLDHLDAHVTDGPGPPVLEPYDLGVLAGLLLRRADALGWEMDVAAGATPVELLLAGVAPIAGDDDEALCSAIAAEVAARDELRAPELDPLVAQLGDPAFVRVVFPDAWRIGSFRTAEFVRLDATSGLDGREVEVVRRLRVEMRAPSAPASIEVSGATALSLTADQVPCADFDEMRAFGFVVPRAALTERAGAYSYEGAGLRFDALPAREAVVGAHTWLCPMP